MSLRDLVIIIVKLGCSGAVIVLISAVFLVVSGDGDVADARADLFDLRSSSDAEHKDFEDVMKDSGLEPRPYDFNGNLVHFAAAESPLPPLELTENYQKRLQRAGVNSRVYRHPLIPTDGHHASPEEIFQDTEATVDKTDAFLSGELVPLTMEQDYVMMGAVVPREELDDSAKEFSDQWAATMRNNFDNKEQFIEHLRSSIDLHELDPENHIAGFRFLEAQHQPNSEMKSHVTATWSDTDFDASRMNDPEFMERRLDQEIPACIGCERTNRIEALDEDEPYLLNQFSSRASASDIGDFYSQAMQNRDWQPTQSDQLLDDFATQIPELRQMHGETLNFERDGDAVTIYISEDPTSRQTQVVTMTESAP